MRVVQVHFQLRDGAACNKFGSRTMKLSAKWSEVTCGTCLAAKSSIQAAARRRALK